MERMKTQVELLKESCDIKDAACVRYQKRIAELEEENKKLNEEVRFLEECLDNKEKLNDGYREEIDKLKIHMEAKDKAYMDLLADYNYLKARIKKTERAFLKYEEKQEKLMGDLDMVVMNR
jgi:chromosome segregation ATPase